MGRESLSSFELVSKAYPRMYIFPIEMSISSLEGFPKELGRVNVAERGPQFPNIMRRKGCGFSITPQATLVFTLQTLKCLLQTPQP